MNDSSIIDKLKELGFNAYEAKVYVALLKNHPATGYEISKESGVPQARAYDTLKTLETMNVVVSNGGKPTTYTPVSPDELLDRRERSFVSCVGFLRDKLPNILPETVEPVTILRGRDPIFKHALELIQHAKESIFMQLWREDALFLQPVLIQAQQRGVIVRIVGYDDCRIDGMDIYQHGLGSDIEHSVGGRWLALAVDNQEGMVGKIDRHDKLPQALISRNIGIVALIRELVIHDIFLLEIQNSLPPEALEPFGRDLLNLRQKILGHPYTFINPAVSLVPEAVKTMA